MECWSVGVLEYSVFQYSSTPASHHSIPPLVYVVVPVPAMKMSTQIKLRVNGQIVVVPVGTVVAAAITLAGVSQFRRSPSGRPCGPLCGMGVCMECRVTIDDRAHCRSCITLCREGMEVTTDD
jgi:D-hydroxyproline dehydrogenase subunit gamma